MIENGYVHHFEFVPTHKTTGYIEIPVEKIVNGEVVTIDTKTIPIVQPKEM